MSQQIKSASQSDNFERRKTITHTRVIYSITGFSMKCKGELLC